MIVAWLLSALGLLTMGLGLFIASGSAASARIELYRSVVRKRPDRIGAWVLLAHGPRVLDRASALATVGAILAGVGTAGVVAPLAAPLAFAVVLLVLLPLVALVGPGVAETLGAFRSEAVVQHLVPHMVPSSAMRDGPASRAELVGGGPHDSAELSALSGVLDFTMRSVREVMTPRTDIVAVTEGAAVGEVARVFAESGFSRVPVYRESLDEIIGMIYVFDLLKIGPGGELPIREVTTVPGSTRCTHLLGDLQRRRRQFAVVLDEYGGTAGIVTIEDLLEELVGEIVEDLTGTVREPPDAQLREFSGSAPLEDVSVHFAIDLPQAGETIGGLLTQVAGKIPRVGDRFSVRGLEFDVIEATPTKVERVIVRRGSPVTMRSPD